MRVTRDTWKPPDTRTQKSGDKKVDTPKVDKSGQTKSVQTKSVQTKSGQTKSGQTKILQHLHTTTLLPIFYGIQYQIFSGIKLQIDYGMSNTHFLIRQKVIRQQYKKAIIGPKTKIKPFLVSKRLMPRGRDLRQFLFTKASNSNFYLWHSYQFPSRKKTIKPSSWTETRPWPGNDISFLASKT